ncbi:MAG TPA: sugar phosphate isomerase/epimerase family protein [Terracidiphilus sp.]|nr:sugar phosphate isomerase/epimerase family protein [Terracidiphilus sp.]
MAYLATMQGRLVPPESGRFQSFPRGRWRDEFALAAQSGLNAIEWIFDVYGEDVNPLTTEEGIAEMRALSETTGTAVRSVCADYFMDRPFLRTPKPERDELIKKVEWLLSRCRRAGVARVVIPFVDNSRIESEEELHEIVSILRTLFPAAERNNVELHIETSLAPQPFAALLEQCQHPLLRVNYDSGNSSSLGYRVSEEFAAYGDRIGSVHVKDRRLGGGTVPLGAGNADLPSLFSGLAALHYKGDYVLQIARSEPGQELLWIAHNRDWVAGQIAAATGVTE